MAGFKGVGIVRDKDGNPKVDDPTTLHPLQIAMLTQAEKTAFGLWDGAFAQDAQGFKRLTKTANGYDAVDALVAVSMVFDGSDTFRLPERVDVPAGGTLI